MNNKSYFILSLFSLVLVGCQSTNQDSLPLKTINDAEERLEQAISDKNCDASFQCRVISYGERACGGPSRFDVYSIKISKQEEVEQYANEITSFERAFNQLNPSLSTCEHNLKPQTLCINNSCTIIKTR